ncbi:SDR family NAD(P)-dependent oxidoreductase [Sphingobium sp.]|uniref:SDR family NAD(P)-dependent oxidoreductase n=1 Tax=Sphingobium sp. TaxID=1912891 RepID=UPI0028BDDBE5|nr:SDR family oxidoreductase [Sphingobium sp.]
MHRRSRSCETAAGGVGPEAFGHGVDVTDPASVAKLVEAVVARTGRLDILVNSAGVFGMGAIVDLTPEDFDLVFAVNAKGTLLMIQGAVRQMMAQGTGGAIVTIASDAGRRPTPGAACYSASKAAAISISQVTALEFAAAGIRSNCIAPGIVRTPMWDHVETQFSAVLNVQPGSAEQAQVRLTPLGRMAEPEDLVEAAIMFASPASSYVTGQTLNVDGGMFCN